MGLSVFSLELAMAKYNGKNKNSDRKRQTLIKTSFIVFFYLSQKLFSL